MKNARHHDGRWARAQCERCGEHYDIPERANPMYEARFCNGCLDEIAASAKKRRTA